ncbi:hypothetical protein DRH27_03915 [Candidatus Falkowbacteria bacterium]|nr:MAG: hypothetical protein DRH27_03915 [Candidatus Falkowbacteria bacterium]
MKKQYKKFVYLVNDISGFLLKKDSANKDLTIKNLRIILIVFIVLFLISLIINLFLIYIKV